MKKNPLATYYKALPPYLGSKQALTPWIFNRLASIIPLSQWENLIFADAFVGGGSISLYAKAKGFKAVHSNDWSDRSQLVIQGLLENQRLTLTQEDKLRLVRVNDTYSSFIQHHYCPSVFSTRHAQALDRFINNAQQFFCPVKKALALLIAWKLVTQFVCMPTSIGTSSRPYAETLNGLRDWQSLNPKRFTDGSMERLLKPTWYALDKLIQTTNRGIFAGSPVIRYHLDAFEFVSKVQGDILYLDPPYPATSNYESANKTLDSVLFSRLPDDKPIISPFSKGTNALEELLDTSKHLPVWIISYGNRVISLDDLIALTQRVDPKRTVMGEARAYTHMRHVAKNTNNQELLVIAYQL